MKTHADRHTECPASFSGHCIWHVATISYVLYIHAGEHQALTPALADSSCWDGRPTLSLLSTSLLSLSVPHSGLISLQPFMFNMISTCRSQPADKFRRSHIHPVSHSQPPFSLFCMTAILCCQLLSWQVSTGCEDLSLPISVFFILMFAAQCLNS